MHIPWHKVLQITKEHSFLSEFSSFENTKPDLIVFEEKNLFSKVRKVFQFRIFERGTYFNLLFIPGILLSPYAVIEPGLKCA